MRMWMVDPKLLCDRHLVGEHGEIHKHLPSLIKGIKIDGRFAEITQIELCSLQTRHDELAIEIDRRAILKGKGGHKSPIVIPDLFAIYPKFFYRKVDTAYSIKDLSQRCEQCKINFKKGS